MAKCKKYSNEFAERQMKNGMRQLLGSLIHTQGRLKFVLGAAEEAKTEDELSKMQVYGKLFQLDVQLEEVLHLLCNEVAKK